jgi:hypothetical protein
VDSAKLVTATFGGQAVGTVVEFRNLVLDHYFVTADPTRLRRSTPDARDSAGRGPAIRSRLEVRCLRAAFTGACLRDLTRTSSRQIPRNVLP